MDIDSLECMPSCDGLDVEGTSHLHFPFPKAHGTAVANGIMPQSGISPATSIRELLECPEDEANCAMELIGFDIKLMPSERRRKRDKWVQKDGSERKIKDKK
ncbi:hypothetical protein IEQ34_007949 [Dendrobium chrysotoxum]|uniref:Uncharacterized protein n=1 Tax=Dendrobium chrysotoxum TaxID=161865 RepID=A0AAV7H658_DENCH|nr:hypothetical protein IEQ34_007949 [Dendrobium chrysotoxum]